MATYPISIKKLIQRFWRKTLITWTLVLMEGLAMVAMPLVIGRAVDDLMHGSRVGILVLALLSLSLLVVGAGRRFYDTRAYAHIYQSVAQELVRSEKKRKSSLSQTSARVNLFTEFIQFLEEDIPGIINQFINLFGTLVIIAFINPRVFIACVACAFITYVVYSLSQKKIYVYNQESNNELERQVETLEANDEPRIHRHFKNVMAWQIKLSDLETLNFSLIWIALAGVLVFTVVTITAAGDASFGQIISAVMYVFGFAESVMTFPLYYQQLIRLQEISVRLCASE